MKRERRDTRPFTGLGGRRILRVVYCGIRRGEEEKRGEERRGQERRRGEKRRGEGEGEEIRRRGR